MREPGDNSDGKELALQTQGLEFHPQNSCQNKIKQNTLDTAVQVCNPNAREAEAAGSLGLTRQCV